MVLSFKHTNARESVPPKERLAATLRHNKSSFVSSVTLLVNCNFVEERSNNSDDA
jgi:hypothetical protein